MNKTEHRSAPDQTAARTQLWSSTLAQYRKGPAHEWGPVLVELAMTALVAQMDSLAEVPADVDIDDVWHQLVAEFLSIAGASGYPSSTARALAFQAARRVSSWLRSQLSAADSI
jgi:hypothetical protein